MKLHTVPPLGSAVLAGIALCSPASAVVIDYVNIGNEGNANDAATNSLYGAYGMNSESAYGTNDQAGNVGEWNDAETGSSRGQRGGS